LLGLTWLKCGIIIRQCKRVESLYWARDLAAMIQVSMVAYMTGGAFLGLAYFDYIYHLIALVAITSYLIKTQTEQTEDVSRLERLLLPGNWLAITTLPKASPVTMGSHK